MANTDGSASVDFNNISQEAYSEIVESLSKDMPLIMHGSGDVPIWDVNPQSSRILAQLTANYISNLVEAAVESQEILNDGKRPSLPPPPLVSKERRRKAPLPSAYEWPPSLLARSSKAATTTKKKKKTTKGEAAKASASGVTPDTKDTAAKKGTTGAKPAAAAKKPNLGEKKKRKRREVDYWDEPLPEPKIKNKPAEPTFSEADTIIYKGVPVEDWVGVAGVDFFEDSRIRDAHVSLPAAVGAQNFIFPVCHDKHLYGKILEIQATRRSMEPILTDSVVMDVIRAETNLQGPFGALRKRREREQNEKKSGGDASGTPEDEEEEPEATEPEDAFSRRPVWPGLDGLLPMHTALDF
mmetsp:Transcript_6263/g.12955  ORF Transcript_6263/g.12955 Transcript_6263/m.12955 type:complete len:354 (+) Transcript_6263:60-1121(+)